MVRTVWLGALVSVVSVGVGSFAFASSGQVPDHFSDFVLFARDSISGVKSDFQGPIGSLGAITLQDFGLRTEPENRNSKQDEILSAVYTGGDFTLIRGEVALGGVTSGGNIQLQSCEIDGIAQASGLVRGSRSCPSRRGVRNQIGALDPNPQVFQFQIEDAALKVERAYSKRFIAPQADIEWINLESFPRTLTLDARNVPGRKFVVRVAAENEVVIRGATVFLERGARPENVLYFFPKASKIVLNQSGSRTESGADLGVPGTILAPHAELLSYSEKLTGAAYVRIFNGICGQAPTVQINAAPFSAWSLFEERCCGVR